MHMRPTPTAHTLKHKIADFSSLACALDYAARGETGCNYYTGSGKLLAVLRYAELREQALALARRLHHLGLERGARVVLLAETTPDFQRFFFACQYAGLVPVPVAPPLQLGGRAAYTSHLQRLLSDCRPSVCVGSAYHLPLLAEAAQGLKPRFLGAPADFAELPVATARLKPSMTTELAHIQYTSGSTSFPRGVMITQQAVMANLRHTLCHLQLSQRDRCVSWLPYYHDMGLVGLVLGPIASQLSVDYLDTREFAMRPRQWLVRMSASHATISFSPPFGYEMCARRVGVNDARNLDLSAWRVAGVGAETIRRQSLAKFAAALAPSGFDKRAFLACYGLAEASLAITLAKPFAGLRSEWIDRRLLGDSQRAERVTIDKAVRPSRDASEFVQCGKPLPGHSIAIRDAHGRALPHRHCGIVYVRGPSVMAGYFGAGSGGDDALTQDGWLNTGDLGYLDAGELTITGRCKDLIIINGRNIWPQDLEQLAERHADLRPGDASAFSVPGPQTECAVLVVQCRNLDRTERQALINGLDRSIRAELGISCIIDVVRPRTLARTSSGKLSRARTRQDFLERTQWNGLSHLAAS